MNLDLQSNQGVLRISPRILVSSSDQNDADFGVPVAIKSFDTRTWAICGTHIFWNNEPSDAVWTDDASTGAATDYSADVSDMELFNNTLVAATNDELLSKALNGSGTGAWTSRDALTTASSHVMTYFKKFDRLYYANGGGGVSNTDNITSVNTAWVVSDPGSDFALTLTPQRTYKISCIRSNNYDIWIGTINRMEFGGGLGKILQWDGISAQVTAEYNINNSQGVMAIAINPDDQAPWVMDSNGVLSAYNSSGFVEMGRLPFPFSKLPYRMWSSENDRFIHPNGMYFTKNGTLRCLINNKTNDGTNVVENMPSGIWEWSKENGFLHIQSLSLMPPTAQPNSTITDYGQNKIERVGALVSANIPSTSVSDGTFYAGATIFFTATSTHPCIFYDNSLQTFQKKGYFVIDWIESDEIADKWERWWMSYRRFLDSGDNITVKYRSVEEDAVQATITWVTTTSFTVLNSAVVVSNYWTTGTGGEVEILQGTGSGSCAHITNAVNVAGTWTVTIDEAVTGVAGTAIARFQKWIRIFPVETLATPANYGQFSLGETSAPRIQIKVCFTQTGIGEFYKAGLISTEDIKATK